MTSADATMISEDQLPPKEKTSLSSEPISLSSLPEEIIENILARVPKWSYPNLSLVSKRFFSLLSSPQLYLTRFNIGTTEPCLYIYLESPYKKKTTDQWVTLSMKPQETRNGEILNDFSLIPLPSSPHSPPRLLDLDSIVAVGTDIYAIGGYLELSSSVRILDCRSHTWRDGPNMMVARWGPDAVYLDEKIYVMGGCGSDEFANWLEVFDIKTQTWRVLPRPGADLELRGGCIVVNPDALERKVYLASVTNDYTYDPKDGTWKVVREVSSFQELLESCVIENVMYSFCNRLKWYDSEGREWREIKGLEGFCSGKRLIRIVNYGGNLIVMWSPEQDREYRKIEIWCAKIALEKRNKNEIWGKTEWVNSVLTVVRLHSFNSVTCVAVSI